MASTRSERSERSKTKKKRSRRSDSERSERSSRSRSKRRQHRMSRSGRSGSKSHKSSKRSSKSHKSKRSSRRSRRSRRSERSRGRNTIKLIYKKGHRYVKITDFVAVSQLIKQHQVTGRVPRSIDLTDYFDTTITILADYIEKGEIKAKISFYALAELLKLTKTFVMEDLQRRLEEILILTADTSTDHLIQAVLVAGTSNITKETENALHYLAAWSFVEMAKLPDFQRIPYHQFVMLLASCELHVAHEVVAADAALLWLVGQPHPAVYVPGVFSVIRSAYLSKVDRQLIVERIATLQMPESVARFAKNSMESKHSSRICLEGTHINRHLVRCGIPDPEKRPKETQLVLSRPREGIKWSEKNLEEQKKSRRSRRSRRSKKSRSRKSRRSSQSKRSSRRSRSQRSSRSKRSPKSERSGSKSRRSKRSSKSSKRHRSSSERRRSRRESRSKSKRSQKSERSNGNGEGRKKRAKEGEESGSERGEKRRGKKTRDE
ncbi:unnamed protein product [Cylicocyclus nassatus]|uniref:BACK domain-containing protein n=1 Tax=Cylicocyclus nassatus TaxID=53992 RepID=A0AA36M505_CYLNA|nr:unnamed protein product [Cylicocyclus nassatus]